MHWKGLRIGTSDTHDSKRHSIFDPRFSEQLPRPTLSTTQVPSRRSESAPRLAVTESDANTQTAPPGIAVHDSKMGTPAAALTHGATPSSRRNRFSFMKLRHASDPQLSRSYAKGEQDVPPVPSLPPRKFACLLTAGATDLVSSSHDHHNRTHQP